jgi:hypothetical protein
MKQIKIFVTANTFVIMAFDIFLLGSIYAYRRQPSVGLVKAVNAFCHGTDNGFRL